MSDDIRSAAERLIRQYDRRQAHVQEKPDILSVAQYALAAEAEVARLRAAIERALLDGEQVAPRLALDRLRAALAPEEET